MRNKRLIIFTTILLILFVVSVLLVLLPHSAENNNTMDEEEATQKEPQIDVSGTSSGIYGSPEDYYNTADGYLVVGGDPQCQHNWNEWILTKASSLKYSGEEMRFCLNCYGSQTREFATLKGEGKSVILDVDCILQMPRYPNGCEIVALTTVLQYMGNAVEVDELIDNHLSIGYFGNDVDDPFYKYLGDPYGLGVGCYAPCIVNTANSYLRSVNKAQTAVDVSNSSFDEYKKYIDDGIPVVFWGTTYMDEVSEIFGTVYIGNRQIIWRSHSHCFVMIGYTDTTYIFCDPLRGIIEYSAEDVINSHDLVYRQACVVK